MKATIYTLAVIAAFIASAAYAPRAHAEDASRASYSPTAPFGANGFAPFARCKALTAVRFDFKGSRDPSSCGLQEDEAYDVWAYFNVRPFESVNAFASWHDTDPKNALDTDRIERWIVAYAANVWSDLHAYSPAMRKGEVNAALEGLHGLRHGEDCASEWIAAYGRFLRQPNGQ